MANISEEQAGAALGAWRRIYNEALEKWIEYCEEILEIPRVLIFAEAGKIEVNPNEIRNQSAVRIGGFEDDR